MKVIGVQQYGRADALAVIERPEPHPGPGEVRLRVEYAGVNPVDAMVRRGDLADWFGDVEPPFVPGMDVVGVVDEIGADATAWPAIGDRVIAVVDNFGGYGAYSQFVVVPAASAVSPPAGASGPEAGSFLMNALTALTAVDALPGIAGGRRVLVTGAAGAVGANAVALAARSGFDVTALASATDTNLLLGLGAARALGSADELDVRFDAVIDTAGAASDLIDSVRDGGAVVVVQPDVPEFDRGITVTHVNVRDRITDTPALAELVELTTAGVLPLRVAGVFPASNAAAAHDKLAERGTRGRYVLDFTSID